MSVLNLPKVLNQKIRVAFAMINDSLANYQAKSEKDEPNGYLGANANGLLNPDQIETDSNNLFVSQTEKDTWNNPSGGSSYPISEFGEIEYFESLWSKSQNNTDWSYLNNNTPSGSVSVTYSSAIKLENNTSVFIRLSLALAGVSGVAFIKPFGSSGNANAEFGAILLYTGVPYTLTVENVHTTSMTTEQTGNISLFSGIGNIYSTSSSLASYSGSGLFIKRNQTVNKGKYTYGKIVNGSLTEVTTNIDFVGEQLIKTKFIYNKATEEASFYLNDVLLGTITAVNLPQTTQILPLSGFANATSTNIFWGWVSRYVKLKKNA